MAAAIASTGVLIATSRRVAAFVVSTTVMALVSVVQGSAAGAGEDPAPVPQSLLVVDTQDGDYVLDELFTSAGTPVSRRKVTLEAASLVPGTDGPSRTKGSGKGGASSASGCRKVTISNRATTYAGRTAYRYNTWTHWCWTRSTQQIRSGGSNGFFVSEADAFQYWRGQVSVNNYFYDAGKNDGHPRSAFHHYRQGRFENCVFKYGCVQTTYPTNRIRSYANGTYAWAMNGVS